MCLFETGCKINHSPDKNIMPSKAGQSSKRLGKKQVVDRRRQGNPHFYML